MMQLILNHEAVKATQNWIHSMQGQIKEATDAAYIHGVQQTISLWLAPVPPRYEQVLKAYEVVDLETARNRLDVGAVLACPEWKIGEWVRKASYGAILNEHGSTGRFEGSRWIVLANHVGAL